MKEEKYKKIVHEADALAKKSLKKFFNNLDLDEEEFEYMNDIPINMIESSGLDDYVGAWYPNSREILIDLSAIEDIINGNPGVDYNRIIVKIAATIVHELIHANRTMLIINGTSISSFDDKLDYETRKHIKEKEGHDFNQYRLFLSDMLSKKYVENFDIYIPLKVNKTNDKLDIILYNRKEKRYEQCKGMTFDFNFNGNVDEYLEKIGYELNKKPIKSEIVLDLFKSESKQIPMLASDYYLGKEKLIDRNDREIEYQNGMEESLTEVVSYIIVGSRKSEQFDLHEIIDKMEKSKSLLDSERIALKIIDKMGEEFLIWFMTSAHELYPYDLLRETFKENYFDLLKCVNNLYEDEMEEFEVNPEDVKKALEIIEKTFTKNKKRT